MSNAASLAKREEAVAKKFQSELFGQTTIDLRPQVTPTPAERHILGDFVLTEGEPDAMALLASIDLDCSPTPTEASETEESLEWFSQLLERAAHSQVHG